MLRPDKLSKKVAPPTSARRRPALDFSLTGVFYVGMMVFMCLAAINSQANLLFGVFGLMIGILLVSGLVSRLVLRKLELRRVIVEGACVGQTTVINYEMTNRKRYWPSLSVSIAELDGARAFTSQPQTYMLHAGPKMTASVPAVVIPRSRGLHVLDQYQIATSFPFGFVKRAATERRRDVMLVYPSLGRVDTRLLALCRSADATGQTMRPRPGGADEFYGVKDYRAGDNPRWIYWRRSARSGTLVLKEMTQVSPPRVLLLVDTFLATRGDAERAAVEQCIAMAASLAATALEQGLSVGLCAWTGEWTSILPTRGKRHREDLLSTLAQLPLNTHHGAMELLDQGQSALHAGTTPVLFTPRNVEKRSGERSSGSMLTIVAGSSQATTWFTFDAGVDFQHAMPPDQQDLRRPTAHVPQPVSRKRAARVLTRMNTYVPP